MLVCRDVCYFHSFNAYYVSEWIQTHNMYPRESKHTICISIIRVNPNTQYVSQSKLQKSTNLCESRYVWYLCSEAESLNRQCLPLGSYSIRVHTQSWVSRCASCATSTSIAFVVVDATRGVTRYDTWCRGGSCVCVCVCVCLHTCVHRGPRRDKSHE